MANEYADAVNPFAGAVNPFEGDDEYSSAVNPFADAVNPFAEEEDGSYLEDMGRSVMAGGAQVGAGAGWLAKKAGELTGSDSLRIHGKAFEDMSTDSANSWRDGISQSSEDVTAKPFLKEDAESMTGYAWGDLSPEEGFRKVGLMLGESLLGTAAGMGAGAGITAGLKLLPGVSRGVAATLGYSSGEALVAAPSSGSQAEQEVRAMPESELAKHVEYQALLLTGTDPEAAKEQLARAAGGDAAIMTAISTAVLSSPFGKWLDDVVGGQAGSTLGGLTKGAMTEGAQETLQSGAEQASINMAMLQQADVDRSLMEGVPEAMVGGLAAGAAMGGGLGAVQGRAEGQRRLDEAAQLRADAVREAGGDELDVELARQEIYMAGEANVDMPLESMPMPEDGPDSPIPYNPFQQEMQPLQVGGVAEDGFGQDNMLPYAGEESLELELADNADLQTQQAGPEKYGNEIEFGAEKPSVLDQKAGTIEQLVEQQSYNDTGPLREPLEQPSELGDPTIPARQEIEKATIAELNEAIKASEKAMPAPSKGNQKVANEEMELAQAIATLGGLNREEANGQGVDSADFGKRAGGIARVFTKGGKSFDEMAEALSELGFFDGEQGYNPNLLLSKLTESMRGNPVYSARSKGAADRAGIQQQIEQIEQEIERHQSNYDADKSEPPLGKNYNGLDDEERALAYTVMEAELEGLDPLAVETILDDDAPVSEITSKLQRNIDNARQKRKGAPQRADQGGSEGHTAPSQSPGLETESGSEESTQEVADTTSNVDEHGYRIPAESELAGLYDQVIADIDSGAQPLPTGQSIQKKFNISISEALDISTRVQAELSKREEGADPFHVDQGDKVVRGNQPASDMFGAVPVAEQSMADLERDKDAKRNGAQDVPADIDGGLFSNQDQQADLTDQPQGEPDRQQRAKEFGQSIRAKQGNVFDLDPNANQDLVTELEPQLARLAKARALFDDKDPATARSRTDRIDGIVEGIKNTIQTGEGLNELPSGEEFNKFLALMERDAGKLRSKGEADAENARIAKNVAAKEEALKSDGDLAKPFESLSDIPGVGLDAKHWVIARDAVDWSGALNTANAVRKKLNSVGVHDSTQGHKANGTDAEGMGSVSGSIERLAMDISGYIKNDKRVPRERRAERIRDFGAALKIEVEPLLDAGENTSIEGQDSPTKDDNPEIRQVNKRLEVLDSLLGCLSG